MNLQDKKYFYFTQNSLTAFDKCPYRFKKIYIDNVKWQQEENDVATEKINFGTDFHKIAERYFRGIPVYEDDFKQEKELYNAFINLKKQFPLKDEELYNPEYAMRFSDDFMRLEANMDLVIVRKNGNVEIWDWKTNAKQINKEKYILSLQTSIYMLVLKKCIKDIWGFDADNDKISMTYFSPERAEIIANVQYSDEKFTKDEKNIKNLIKKVYNFEYSDFDRNKYAKSCKFCEFALFCDNQTIPAEKEEFALSWEDIPIFE